MHYLIKWAHVQIMSLVSQFAPLWWSMLTLPQGFLCFTDTGKHLKKSCLVTHNLELGALSRKPHPILYKWCLWCEVRPCLRFTCFSLIYLVILWWAMQGNHGLLVYWLTALLKSCSFAEWDTLGYMWVHTMYIFLWFRNRVILEAEAESESIRVKGEAEAFAIEAKAKAEAEQMAKKADAWKDYQDAAMVDMILETLPKVCKNSFLGANNTLVQLLKEKSTCMPWFSLNLLVGIFCTRCKVVTNWLGLVEILVYSSWIKEG